MCDPSVLVSVGLSIASGVAGVIGQSQAAAQQSSYQNQLALARNQQIEENNALARASYLNQINLQNAQQQQLDAQASDDTQALQRENQQKIATALVSAGESGVSGLSIDSLISDYYRQDAINRANISTNRQYGREQAQAQADAYRAQALGQVASLKPYVPEPITQPNFLASSLQIAGNAYSSYQSARYSNAQNSQGSRYKTAQQFK